VDTVYQLVGVGIGPFNLSLAALLDQVAGASGLFLEQKPGFDWHSELLFSDSDMQTCYLKDLVTPIDPTNPYSFLNYLVESKLFYHFMNTSRRVISRREFEVYCKWVVAKITSRREEARIDLKFNSCVRAVDFDGRNFVIRTDREEYKGSHICLATGPTPLIPDCMTDFIGDDVFHAKSKHLQKFNASNKDLVIVGGGQTGIEVFRNALAGKWGPARSIKLYTARKNLEPLDETAFTNDYFLPSYVQQFLGLSSNRKEEIVASQKLASDGNTPAYLADLYTDLYQRKLIDGDRRPLEIFACRRLALGQRVGSQYRLTFNDEFSGGLEEVAADAVILCTGFRNKIPKVIEPLLPRIPLDSKERFLFKDSFAIHWDGPSDHKIYALNLSRHHHGIVEPQTSLMAWRSASVINDLLETQVYPTHSHPGFVRYSR